MLARLVSIQNVNKLIVKRGGSNIKLGVKVATGIQAVGAEKNKLDNLLTMNFFNFFF